MTAWQNALKDLNNGRHAAALAAYHSLVQQFPGVPQLWTELGLAASEDLEFTLADQAFERATELAPTDAALLVYIGKQYYRLRQLDRATGCLERALAADPKSAEARVAMSVWLERNRRLDEALECLEACLSHHPKTAWARYFRAFLLHRKGLDAEAETALRNLVSDPLLPTEVQADAHYLLAEILDKSGRYAEALICLGNAKGLRRKTMDVNKLEQYYESMNRARRETLAQLTPETFRRWREEAADSPCPYPLACVAGAARSGTTLLEQILGAHPEILVFDETYSFEKEIVNPLHSPSSRTLILESLENVDGAARARLIGRYFKSLLRETEDQPGAKLLLDKNPSLTIWLHVWLRLFPQSKVVMALRDPRDVIVSCYFQNFPLSWAIVGFLSLERTAKYYVDNMDAWLRLRDLGGFDWIETRYEDVVANLEAEGQRVTNFLGLPWHEAQANYYNRAERKYVHSPTYNEVTKPVYNRSVARWKHYAEAIAPLQERLQPYLRAFRYE